MGRSPAREPARVTLQQASLKKGLTCVAWQRLRLSFVAASSSRVASPRQLPKFCHQSIAPAAHDKAWPRAGGQSGMLTGPALLARGISRSSPCKGWPCLFQVPYRSLPSGPKGRPSASSLPPTTPQGCATHGGSDLLALRVPP